MTYPSTTPTLDECLSAFEKAACQQAYQMREGVKAVMDMCVPPAAPVQGLLTAAQIEEGHRLHRLRRDNYTGPSQLCDAFTAGVHYAESLLSQAAPPAMPVQVSDCGGCVAFGSGCHECAKCRAEISSAHPDSAVARANRWHTAIHGAPPAAPASEPKEWDAMMLTGWRTMTDAEKRRWGAELMAENAALKAAASQHGEMGAGVQCERCGLAPNEHAGAHWCDNQSFASAQEEMGAGVPIDVTKVPGYVTPAQSSETAGAHAKMGFPQDPCDCSACVKMRGHLHSELPAAPATPKN